MSQDPEALLAVSDRLADMTAWGQAVAAATEAALFFDRRHQVRAGQAARRRAEASLGRCEGMRALVSGERGGTMQLTKRERQVATMAMTGSSSQEIADRLHVSHRTIESHLHHAYVKLGVRDRAELAAALGGTISQ
jgi:DNA-binding NarL/FixJ family response regulator